MARSRPERRRRAHTAPGSAPPPLLRRPSGLFRPTLMPATEAVGPPGYVPVPMRTVVDAKEALAFISTPTYASGVVRHGASRRWTRDPAAARRGASDASSGTLSPPSAAAPAVAPSCGIRQALSSLPPYRVECAPTPSWSPLPPTRRLPPLYAGDHQRCVGAGGAHSARRRLDSWCA